MFGKSSMEMNMMEIPIIVVQIAKLKPRKVKYLFQIVCSLANARDPLLSHLAQLNLFILHADSRIPTDKSLEDQLIQYIFCATNSRSGSFGLFSYTRVASGSNELNYVIESSILNCQDQSQSRVITMNNGICGITASNFSKNVVYWVAAMCINYAKDECIVNFSTIEKNTASYSMIMEFQDGVKYHAYLCNIVGNSNKGIIRTNNAELIVENCTILGNPEPGSSLYSDGTLKVINCNVDNYFRISGNAASTVKVFTTKIIYKLHHLSTYKCEAIYPLGEEFININSDIDHPYVFNFSFLIYYSSEINIAMLY